MNYRGNTMDLSDYLYQYGYCKEDAIEISRAYYDYGFNGVKEVMKYLDDESHDYSGEAVDNIKKWIIQEKHLDNFDFIFFET